MDRPDQPNKRHRILFLLISVFFFIVIIGIIVYPKAREKWSAPLGPGLDLPTNTPIIPTKTEKIEAFSASDTGKPITPIPSDSIVEDSTPTNIPTQTSIPTQTKTPQCGGPPLMYLLGIGIDTKDLSYTYGLADVIRIARVDFVTPKVTVLSIPRDLWVEIPEIEDHGITQGKINQSFFYGGPGMSYYDGPGAGPGLVARTINHNLDLRADHYGALNMYVFEEIIDAVGGIDLYLPQDVDGTPVDKFTRDMGYFYAGNNHFNGEQAVKFSRIRKRYSDYKRVDNQNLVICALREKLLSPSVLPRVPKIISSFHGSVLTDLSLEQLGQLACLLPKIESENLIFSSLPREILEHGYTYSPQMKNKTYATNADMEALRDYIDRFKTGDWPEKQEESTCP